MTNIAADDAMATPKASEPGGIRLSLGAIGLVQATLGRQNHTPAQTVTVWAVRRSLIPMLAGGYF